MGRRRRPRATSTQRWCRKGKLLTQYYGIGHVSLDNYIAEISGQSPNPSTQSDCVNYVEFAATGIGQYGQALGQGCVYPKSVKTVADQLTAAGKTWRSYQEDMGTPCRHPAIGATDDTIVARKGDMYATRHNPFVYFHSIIDTPACAQNVVDFDQLATDLEVDRDDPEPLVHHAEPVSRRTRLAVRRRRAGRTRLRRSVPCHPRPEDPGIARVQGRRHARDHGRRSVHHEHGRVLSHAAVTEYRRSRGSTGRAAAGSARSCLVTEREGRHYGRHAVQPLRVVVQHRGHVRLEASRIRRRARSRVLRQRRLRRSP